MGITLELRPHVQKEVTEQEIRDSLVFRDWAQNFDPGMQIKVTVNEASVWAEHGQPQQVHGLQISFEAAGQPWKHTLMLRPPTVDVLTLLTYEDEQHVIFVEQFRPAVGARIMSNPAGGKKWDQTWEQAATAEVWEELRLDDYPHLNLGQYFTLTPMTPEPREVSPGIINERTKFFKAEFAMPSRDELVNLAHALHGKTAGVEADGEFIKVFAVYKPDVRMWLSFHPRVDLKTEVSLFYAGM